MVASISFETTSTTTPVCLHSAPLPFKLTVIIILLLLFSCLPLYILFSLRAVNGQVYLWLGITEFFPCICPRAARMWDKSPCNGLAPRSHCLYSLIDAGMLEVTHESRSAFHAYSWHAIEATHCVCVWVCSPAPCGPVLVLPCLAAPAHFLIQCCFEMLTLYKRKRKCKKKKKPTHEETHTICICIYTCPYNYT